jgi:hypothetical protein
MLHQELWSYFSLGFPSWVFESAILPTQMNLFFQRLDSAGQPMGSHAHAYQAFLFQVVDLVDQSSHLRDFEWSRLFTLGSLELGELAYEGWEDGFVILTVEPCSMPSLERIFHEKIKETSTRAGLEAYTPYNFLVGGVRLVFKEEMVFE